MRAAARISPSLSIMTAGVIIEADVGAVVATVFLETRTDDSLDDF